MCGSRLFEKAQYLPYRRFLFLSELDCLCKSRYNRCKKVNPFLITLLLLFFVCNSIDVYPRYEVVIGASEELKKSVAILIDHLMLSYLT